MRRDPWQAVADPTRRRIVELLSVEEMTINEVAEHFDMSRPAVSKQIKILEQCNLLLIEDVGRQRKCRVSLEGLQEIHDWIKNYESFWISRVDRLDQYLKRKKK